MTRVRLFIHTISAQTCFTRSLHVFQLRQPLQEGGSDAHGFMGEPWQTPLTADDAAFMQINARDGPFP